MDNDEELEKNIEMLFSGDNFHFGNPLKTFKKKLLTGKFSPAAVKLNSILKEVG